LQRTPTQTDTRDDGHSEQAISAMVVRVLREHTGHGPSRARTVIDGDFVRVLLHDTLTSSERTLVAAGNPNAAFAMRTALQDTMAAKLVAGVEELTGRTVLVSLSDHAIDPDIALEAFLLAPQG
jgi:uncharacterized protein YbcI